MRCCHLEKDTVIFSKRQEHAEEQFHLATVKFIFALWIRRLITFMNKMKAQERIHVLIILTQSSKLNSFFSFLYFNEFNKTKIH